MIQLRIYFVVHQIGRAEELYTRQPGINSFYLQTLKILRFLHRIVELVEKNL